MTASLPSLVAKGSPKKLKPTRMICPLLTILGSIVTLRAGHLRGGLGFSLDVGLQHSLRDLHAGEEHYNESGWERIPPASAVRSP
jgi:hypothetical protein